jgi:Flp pilus assembly protein TadB
LNILQITFSISLSLGLFFIFSDVLKFPRLKTIIAIHNAQRQDKKKAKTIDTIILDIAIKLSKFMKLDEYKRKRMEYTLKAAGTQFTPEVYIAKAYVKAGLILVGIVPALYIFPLIAPVITFLAIAVYFKEIKSADEKLKSRREVIENDLPRFVSTIEQELRATRDVLSILERYKKHASEILSKELEITCADMRSGSYEAALTRFETRLNSPQLSEIVRGLISVMRGDNGIVYFQMLSHDLKILELQRLKTIATKRPAKIRKYSFLLVACFMITYLVVMGVQIMNSLNGLF